MMKPPRTILSTGPGRLHFVELACALQDAGEDVRLVTGWIPGRLSRWLTGPAGVIMGRPNLAKRLEPRLAGGKISRERLLSCTAAEGLAMAAFRIKHLGILPAGSLMSGVWRNFGRSSRRYLRDADIFHVRSGAGQGGAIATARARGMKIVTDHSIAHPRHLESAVNPVHERYAVQPMVEPGDAFQKLLLDDCVAADCVLVNSDFVKHTFTENGFPPDRIRVAYLGVRDDFIGLKQSWRASQPFRLLYTGGFVLRKGVDTFVSCLRELCRRGFAHEAIAIGSADDLELLRRDGPLPSSLKMVPRVPQDELAKHLATSDLYVFPTLAEGCAKSAMEALAAGLPVVTTAACGLPAVHASSMWLVEPNDPIGLADTVERLAADEALRESIGRTGIELVRSHYRWADFGRQVRLIHEALLGAGG
jgi:glycosyltransferase involved in cell wall biosynthesis